MDNVDQAVASKLKYHILGFLILVLASVLLVVVAFIINETLGYLVALVMVSVVVYDFVKIGYEYLYKR